MVKECDLLFPLNASCVCTRGPSVGRHSAMYRKCNIDLIIIIIIITVINIVIFGTIIDITITVYITCGDIIIITIFDISSTITFDISLYPKILLLPLSWLFITLLFSILLSSLSSYLSLTHRYHNHLCSCITIVIINFIIFINILSLLTSVLVPIVSLVPFVSLVSSDN